MTTELCERMREDLPALHYGDLPAEERGAVEGHLSGCAPCRAALDAVRETAASLDRLTVPMPHEAEWARLDARIESRVAPLRAARMARSYGRFPVLARIAAAALVGTLAVVSAGLYSQTREQAAEIALLQKSIGDEQWGRGEVALATRSYGLAFRARPLADDPLVERRLAAAKGIDEGIARLYAQTREAGAEREIRERIGELLARYPGHALADQAFLALGKTGVPTPPPLEQALTQPAVPLVPARALPGLSLEETTRGWIDQMRHLAADAPDAKPAAYALLRAGNAAETALSDRALAAELYREAARRLPDGAIATAAAARLDALERAR